MLVTYCKACLPDKVVMGFGSHRADIDLHHEIHEQRQRNGIFALTNAEAESVVVEDDDTTTKANILATFGDRIV